MIDSCKSVAGVSHGLESVLRFSLKNIRGGKIISNGKRRINVYSMLLACLLIFCKKDKLWYHSLYYKTAMALCIRTCLKVRTYEFYLYCIHFAIGHLYVVKKFEYRQLSITRIKRLLLY